LQNMAGASCWDISVSCSASGILPKSGLRFQFLQHSHCHQKRRDEVTDFSDCRPHLKSCKVSFASFQAIVAYMRGADAISPRFHSSGRCGHGHSCPTGLCVRAHEEVQFQLVSRRNTLTMTSRLSVVNVSLTEADNSYARRELLSDRSFDVNFHTYLEPNKRQRRYPVTG
jgi:hypothetical protein